MTMNFEKGVALYKEGDFETALAVFQELSSAEHGNAQFHLFRGRTLTRLGKGDEALADFDILIELEPYNTDFMSDRGVVLHLLGRNEDALTELDRAANLDPRNPYRYSSRAYLKDRIGDFLGAIADYEKALLQPEDAEAYQKAFELMELHQAWDYETTYKQILFKLSISADCPKISGATIALVRFVTFCSTS